MDRQDMVIANLYKKQPKIVHNVWRKDRPDPRVEFDDENGVES